MKSVNSIIDRMIKASKAKNMAEMLKICRFGKSSGSTWRKRGSISAGSIARVANQTGCRLDWLKTGQGEMYSSPPANFLREVPDDPRDDYQSHPDGSKLHARVMIYLDTAEWVLKSDTAYAKKLEQEIEKYYLLTKQQQKQRQRPPEATGTDNNSSGM